MASGKKIPSLSRCWVSAPHWRLQPTAINGLGMGLSTTAVLVAANVLIAALRNVIPEGVRLPGEIVVVASLVTVVDMLMEGFVPSLYSALGIYIPLIVCKLYHPGTRGGLCHEEWPLLSAMDGIGMGVGFTIALVCIGSLREILGAGTIFGIKVTPAGFEPISIFILAPGAFFVLSILTALQNKLKAPSATNGSVKKKKKSTACNGDCMSCPSHSADKE